MAQRIAVVYWSGTGNTEEMAGAVAAGAQEAGADVTVAGVADFSADDVASYDALAFGCPAMGDEVLEEGEFQPLWDECVPALGEKPVVLFGSYDWGTGGWMETWSEEAGEAGIRVVGTAIANLEPDDDALEACRALGAMLVEP